MNKLIKKLLLDDGLYIAFLCVGGIWAFMLGLLIGCLILV